MKTDNPIAGLERVFHEPARLAITSALCAGEEGRTFSDLKLECDLTDGNLNRHLKVLIDHGVARSRRLSEGTRPVTVVQITPAGRAQFLAYLQALEEVLRKAAEALDRREGWRSGVNALPRLAES
jgi:DNA-binding MarR family transcriptional regulator